MQTSSHSVSLALGMAIVALAFSVPTSQAVDTDRHVVMVSIDGLAAYLLN